MISWTARRFLISNTSFVNSLCQTHISRILPFSHSFSLSLPLKRKRIRVKPARRADRRRIYDCDWFFRRHGASLWTHNKKHKRLRSVGHADTNRVYARARVYMAFCLSFNPGDLVIFSFLPSRALLSLPYLLSSLNFFFSLSNCVKSDSMSLSLSVAFYEFRFICTKRKRKKKRSKWIFERSLTWIVFEGQTAGHPGGSRRTVHLVLCAKKFIRFVDNETKGEENHNSKNRR